jgi:hypothetical protein
MTLWPYSRSCRTASIRSGIAGGLAGELGGLDGLIECARQFAEHVKIRFIDNCACSRPWTQMTVIRN